MKHTKRWTSREGIVYSFENDKIISFQDNFRQMRDVPFTFYFDFETTTGNDIFKDPKMFVKVTVKSAAFTVPWTLTR